VELEDTASLQEEIFNGVIVLRQTDIVPYHPISNIVQGWLAY